MRLFVAAEPREFSGFLPFCTTVAPLDLPVHWARVGNWNGQQMIAIANGAGAARAASAVNCVLSITRALAVCSTGFCGALDASLNIGDVVVADTVDGLPTAAPRSEMKHHMGHVISADHIVATAEEKGILAGAGAAAVDMESGAIAQRAEHFGVPFYCVRSVTDLAGESFSNDFGAALQPDGRFGISRLLLGAMARPATRLPELFRLQRRCGIAARRLGVFLDSCEF
jgi:adenosylhomocysteine nucleosidase